MKTQKNSRARVKDPGDLNATLDELYAGYAKMGPSDFYSLCTRLIDESHSNNVAKKLTIKAALMARSGDRDRMLQIVSNYFLAGAGLGV